METRDLVFFVASTALHCLVGLAALRHRLRREPGPCTHAGVVGSLAAVGIVSGFVVAIGLATALGGFGVLHVAWLDVAVVAPVVGLGAWFVAVCGRGATRAARVLATVCLLGAPLAAYASFFEPQNLEVELVTVPLDPARRGEEPLRVGVIADLQTTRIGEHEREAVRRLMELEPDVVLLAGDYYQGPVDGLVPAADDFRDLLSELRAPGGVWAVIGDIDAPDTPELFKGTGVRLLVDELVRVDVRDRSVVVLGLANGSPFRGLAQLESVEGEDEIAIVLAHKPRAVLELPENGRADLVVAGHTHGGQVVLPLFGPPITFSPLPRSIAGGGLAEVDGNRVYVSRGVGMERGQAPRIRFLCPPEISLLTLE